MMVTKSESFFSCLNLNLTTAFPKLLRYSLIFEVKIEDYTVPPYVLSLVLMQAVMSSICVCLSVCLSVSYTYSI